MNNSEFKYKIVDHTIIIEKCPNDTLTPELINRLSIFNSRIGKYYLCDGIKEIGESAFACHGFINSIRLPNTLKKIDNKAFYNCCELKEIIIPESCEYIGEHSFFECYFLEKVVMPNSIKQINSRTFSECFRLKDIKLPSELEKLGDCCFEDCYDLVQLELPKKLKYISKGVFLGCNKLKEITIPEGVTELNQTFSDCTGLVNVILPKSLKNIGGFTFYNCSNLKNIKFGKGLEMIGESAFYNCGNLEEVVLPNTLKTIGVSAFSFSGLISITIPDSVVRIDKSAFCESAYLEKAILGKGLKRVGDSCFKHCTRLKSVDFKGNTREIGKETFYCCSVMENIRLPQRLEKIENGLLFGCDELKRIEIPEGVREIQRDSFYSCENLEEIKFPSTLDCFDSNAVAHCPNLQKIVLNDGGEEKEIKLNSLMFIRDNTKKLFICDCFSRKTLGFYNEGKYITFEESLITENNVIKQMMEDRKINSDNFVSLYYWLNKKFIPSHIVIKNMPLKDIDNFFINKNYIEWSKLLKEYPIYYDENKTSFFKLCYVLGVFSKSTSIRDKAIKFLKENIVGHRNENWIHSRFDGFDLNNGFNEEYAEFFIKYYDGKNFMTIKPEFGPYIDLMAASYNNFKQVKKVYPNKTLHTNRASDLLLPEHVMDAIRTISYEDVDEGNEEFAKVIGRYGYTQEQFEKLQSWYNIGKSLTNLRLFVGKDTETEGITYKLLSKEDPLNAVLGNITNCCQVLEGQGEDCVEFGMIEPNSGFITFNYKDKIIGQAWVWYDEVSKTVCLDNIEVPHNYLEKVNQNKTIQKSFIDCLLRLEDSIKKEMNEKGLKVERVLIGEGYNDIKTILSKTFDISDKTYKLSGYSGYSDASSQYEIKLLEKRNNRK